MLFLAIYLMLFDVFAINMGGWVQTQPWRQRGMIYVHTTDGADDQVPAGETPLMCATTSVVD